MHRRTLLGCTIAAALLPVSLGIAQPAPNSGETNPSLVSVPAGSLQRVQGDWRASAVMGTPVFNETGQRLATVRDLLVADDGRIGTVVLSVMSSRKLVAVAFDRLRFVPSRRFDSPLSIRGRTSRMGRNAHADLQPHGILLAGATRESLAEMAPFRMAP